LFVQPYVRTLVERCGECYSEYLQLDSPSSAVELLTTWTEAVALCCTDI
jgi:hypothetical protein